MNAFQLDFSKGALHYRFSKLQGRNELIAKAVGWRQNTPLSILDATAGLGREAFLLAGLGCSVTLFERHPQVAALLKEALKRAAKEAALEAVIARMQLIESCAILYLTTQDLMQAPEVIYCDPMFPPRPKTALVKKEMQFLQQVVGPDEDAAQLVKVALSKAKKRVVVKLPHYAPSFLKAPQICFKGRSHRFDVYLISR